MDKVKLIDLLYEVLPYVQKGEQLERVKRRGQSVSVRVWETIKMLEKWGEQWTQQS